MPDSAGHRTPSAATPPDPTRLLTWIGELAAQVHGAVLPQEKLEWVVTTTRELTGAEFVAVAALDSGSAVILASAGADPQELSQLAKDQLTDIVRSFMAVSDSLDWPRVASGASRGVAPRQHRGRVRIRNRWGGQLAIPIVAANGTLHGGLLLGHHDVDFFDDADVLLARAGAAHLGAALDNTATFTRLAELEAAQREAAHQLQYAMLPPIPSIEGVELGRYYLAADPSALTGGDLYDWMALPNGDVHLAVVDVLGKGVGATKDALATTHALRLLVLNGCALEDLVASADRIVTVQNPELVATVVVGSFSPATGMLRLAGGGHPPPLLVRANGEVSQIEAGGVPIGWPGAGSDQLVEVALDRSDTVVLYTDGLVEAGKNIIAGLASLEAVAHETASYPAAQMARLLVERGLLAGAERQDDALALVLRRRTAPIAEGQLQLGPFEHRFSPNVAMVGVARHLLLDWLGAQPIDEAAIDDLLIVATELCANAIEASSGAERAVALRARAEGDALVLEVEDDGPGFSWPDSTDDEPPDLAIERGRGLFLVRALSDDVEVSRHDDHTIVRSVKRAVLGGRAPQPTTPRPS